MIQKPSRSQLTDSRSFGLLINGPPCQFESLRDPFVVMFSVPFALVGVILIWKNGKSSGGEVPNREELELGVNDALRKSS